jgi:hypothetical protein
VTIPTGGGGRRAACYLVRGGEGCEEGWRGEEGRGVGKKMEYENIVLVCEKYHS